MSNKKFYIESSDDSINLSDTNTVSPFSSIDSFSSFEDYRINIDYDKKEDKTVSSSSCNYVPGFISSVCCSWCSRS